MIDEKINLYQALLSSPALVLTPVIQVKIGEYTFGVYDKDKSGFARYPNYVQSLQVSKINGQVNTYSLQLVYPITENNDPNYFEKVFASVAKSREIEFSYGDASVPSYLYRNEKAMITKVNSHFNLDAARIEYTVSAISRAMLALTGSYSFPAIHAKPSQILRDILQNPYYGLQNVFSGMSNMTAVDMKGLIPGNDDAVTLEKKDNISVLEYMQYLVASMTPAKNNERVAKDAIYILTFDDNTSGDNPGPFFKITEVDKSVKHPEAYQLDIGYPSSNCITNFNVENDENYSILYDYQEQLHPQEYVTRINANGDYEEVYAPVLSSGNPQHHTKEDNKAWWSKVTNYPIKASVSIKGLLRPAILMTYVRLNIYMFGQKHINSGLYIITKQTDRISGQSGYMTDLNMLRVGEDS